MDVVTRITIRGLVAICALVVPTTASAATYYAAPNGMLSGACLTTETACHIALVQGHAVNPGDNIVLAEGTYDIVYEVNIPSGVNVTGASGGGRPVLRSTSDQYGVKMSGGRITNLEIEATGPYGLKLEAGADADHVDVRVTNGVGFGVQMTGPDVTLKDSTVWAKGPAAIGVDRQGNGTATIQSATIWAEGVTSTGLRSVGSNGTEDSMNCLTPATTPTTLVISSILHGNRDDAIAQVVGAFPQFCAQGSSKVFLSNSIVRESATRRLNGAIVEAVTESNLVSDAEGAPDAIAIDGANGDLRPPVGMPGIDKGYDFGISLTDVVGFERKIGLHSDIGAFETPQMPALTGIAASATSPTSAVVSGTLTPGGAPTSLLALYGTDTLNTQTQAVMIGSGATPATQSSQLTGLIPNTSYQAALRATSTTSVERSSTSTAVGFTTPAAVSISRAKAPKVHRAGKGRRKKVYVATGMNLHCRDVGVSCIGNVRVTDRSGRVTLGSARVVVKQGQSRGLAVLLNKRGQRSFSRKRKLVIQMTYVGGSVGAPASTLSKQLQLRTR
jgi:hypothetical protein